MKNDLHVYECSMAKEPNVKTGKETVRMMYGVPVIESHYIIDSNVKTIELNWNTVSFGTKQTQVARYHNHLNYYSVSFLHQNAVILNTTCNQEQEYTCIKIIYQADAQYIIWKMSLEAFRHLICNNGLLSEEFLFKEKQFDEKEAKNMKSVLENYRKTNAVISGLNIIRTKSESAVI